jgi:hypothetical protein
LRRRGQGSTGFDRFLLVDIPPHARLEFFDLGFEHGCFRLELMAALDARIVRSELAARLLDVALESVELAKLAGDRAPSPAKARIAAPLRRRPEPGPRTRSRTP